VNDLYKENYKPLKKQFEEDYRSWCMILAKNKYEDQGNRIKDQDMKPHNYTQLIFDKVTKNM
jgi:hypothetical protein